MLWTGLLLLALLATGLAYHRAPLWVWTLAGAILLAALTAPGTFGSLTIAVSWIAYAVLALSFNLRPLRRQMITRHVLRAFRRAIPRIF